MTPEQVRAEAIERLARHDYDAAGPVFGRSDWESATENLREAYRGRAEGYVDALGDMLPTGEAWGVATPGWAWKTEYRTEQEARAEAGTWEDGRVQHAWTHEPTEVRR